MAEDLTATLGVDGRPFVSALDAIGAKATMGMAKVGKRMGAQLTSGLLAVVGFSFLNRMIGETQRWAKDTAKVREEYEAMGIVITDEFASKMALVGREFTALGVQWKTVMLPIVAGFGKAAIELVQSMKETWRYWKLMYDHALSPRLDTAADFWTKFTEVMKGERLQGREVGFVREGLHNKIARAWREASSYVGQHSEQPKPVSTAMNIAGAAVAAMRAAWNSMWSKIQVFKPAGEPIKIGSSGRGGGSRLAAIGGDVGGLNDRVVRIEQEQVRILGEIARNTKAMLKPKTSGTVEIPTS